MNFFIYMTPQRIYEELTGGPGSGALSEAQGRSQHESAAEQDRADEIRQLAAEIQGGWQGSAADGAYGAATPLAASALDGAEHLYRAQDLLDRQGGSFGRASNSVVPMPEKPETGILDDMTPWDTDTEKQVKTYQADAQHNTQVFEGYDNASLYNENMPREYTITNHSGGTMTVTPGDTIDSDDYRRSGGETGGGPGNYSAPGGGGPGGTGNSGGLPGGSSGGSPLPGGSPGSQTSPNEYRPAPAPGYSSGGYPQSPAAHQPTTVPPGGMVPGPVGGYPGGPGGGGSGSGGVGGRGGGQGGGGAGGPGGRGGLGPGAGAGALAAEEAAARRGPVGGAAPGGRSGMGPMGAPMGAGRGKGDDDSEHERKVLIEPDPESTFGSDVMTAPQVIGDDAYEN